MLLSILQIVALPIGAGLIINRYFGRVVRAVEGYLPLVSMVAIVLIIGAVVGANQGNIATVGPLVMLGVVLHNGLGLLGGYWGGRLLGFDESICRTLAIEVGMQNSGLAATLGKLYFTPLAALPGAQSNGLFPSFAPAQQASMMPGAAPGGGAATNGGMSNGVLSSATPSRPATQPYPAPPSPVPVNSGNAPRPTHGSVRPEAASGLDGWLVERLFGGRR